MSARCRWLDGTVDKTFHKNTKGAMAVGVKTAADQLIWAPVMTVVFFAFLKLMEGQPDLVRPLVPLGNQHTLYLVYPGPLFGRSAASEEAMLRCTAARV